MFVRLSSGVLLWHASALEHLFRGGVRLMSTICWCVGVSTNQSLMDHQKAITADGLPIPVCRRLVGGGMLCDHVAFPSCCVCRTVVIGDVLSSLVVAV